jgi:hypothetical protein
MLVSGFLGFRDDARFVPEAETVDAVFGFRDGEEALSVPAFDADADDDFSLPLDGAGVEGGVDAEALHEEWVGPGIEVVTPFERDVPVGDDGMGVAFVDSVVPGVVHGILALDQGFVGAAEGGEAGGVGGFGHGGKEVGE